MVGLLKMPYQVVSRNWYWNHNLEKAGKFRGLAGMFLKGCGIPSEFSVNLVRVRKKEQ